MNFNTYNLIAEKLSIDYLTFNLKNGRNKIEEIAEKFSHAYQIDSYLVNDEYSSQQKKTLKVKGQKYQVIFALNINPSNKKTIGIRFSGLNAEYFYRILKDKKYLFIWEDFFNVADLKLSRIDINYTDKKYLEEKIITLNLINFFECSIQKYKQRYPSVTTWIEGRETEQPTMCITSRTGENFLRVYKNKLGLLKFELEIKKGKARNYTNLFTQYCFGDFETEICDGFYRYLKASLVLDTLYTDWLNYKLRKTNNRKINFVFNYLKKDSVIDKPIYFYRLLQFLTFSQTCNMEKNIIQNQVYYTLKFPLTDFAKKINVNIHSTYQRRKLIQFFESLQKLPSYTEWFSDSEFISLLLFPILEINNENNYSHTKLIVRISMSEKLYNYRYPFHFPQTFFYFESKDDLRVKSAIIQSFSIQMSSQKQFSVNQFLNQFNSINNKRKSNIKKNIIRQFQLLLKDKVIDNNFKLVLKDKSIFNINGQELTIEFINKTDQLIYYEII